MIRSACILSLSLVSLAAFSGTASAAYDPPPALAQIFQTDASWTFDTSTRAVHPGPETQKSTRELVCKVLHVREADDYIAAEIRCHDSESREADIRNAPVAGLWVANDEGLSRVRPPGGWADFSLEEAQEKEIARLANRADPILPFPLEDGADSVSANKEGFSKSHSAFVVPAVDDGEPRYVGTRLEMAGDFFGNRIVLGPNGFDAAWSEFSGGMTLEVTMTRKTPK